MRCGGVRKRRNICRSPCSGHLGTGVMMTDETSTCNHACLVTEIWPEGENKLNNLCLVLQRLCYTALENAINISSESIQPQENFINMVPVKVLYCYNSVTWSVRRKGLCLWNVHVLGKLH